MNNPNFQKIYKENIDYMFVFASFLCAISRLSQKNQPMIHSQ